MASGNFSCYFNGSCEWKCRIAAFSATGGHNRVAVQLKLLRLIEFSSHCKNKQTNKQWKRLVRKCVQLSTTCTFAGTTQQNSLFAAANQSPVRRGITQRRQWWQIRPFTDDVQLICIPTLSHSTRDTHTHTHTHTHTLTHRYTHEHGDT